MKIVKIILKIFRILVTILLIAFSSAVCIQRFSNNKLTIFGYRMFSVATGSMVPMYNIGDVVLCKVVDPKTLKVGNDITYMGKQGSYKDKLITHRIIKITKDDSGNLIFQTQGIATTQPDPIIKSDQIYGKIVGEVEILSKVYKLVTTTGGFALCIIIPIMFIIASEILTAQLEKLEDKREMQISQNSLVESANAVNEDEKLKRERELTAQFLANNGINLNNPQLNPELKKETIQGNKEENNDIDEFISF